MIDVDRIIRYEAGEMDSDEIKDLFQDLVISGEAWILQGHYGRAAKAMLDAGLIKYHDQYFADLGVESSARN